MNKKAIAMEMIGWIIFISVCFILITGLIYQTFSKAQNKAASITCRASVALREKSTVGIDVVGINIEKKLTPLLCKTVDKKVPKEGRDKDVALKEFSDLIAGCWWQFLEGTSKNTFGKYDILFAEEKCFVCYSVSLQSDFKGQELRDFLDSSPHIIDDGSDHCTIDGRGECKTGNSCSEGLVYEGGNCDSGEVCCMTDSICDDKGGECKDSCGSKESYYPLWDCGDQKCCLNPDNMVTYTNYVQKYNGDGYIAINNNMNFDRRRNYAITYVAEADAITGAGAWWADVWQPNKHRILVTTLSDVSNNCLVLTGTGGE